MLLKKIVILNMINFFNDEILLIKQIKISSVLISTFFNEVRYLTSSKLPDLQARCRNVLFKKN